MDITGTLNSVPVDFSLTRMLRLYIMYIYSKHGMYD
jgi:hypothetical protein